LILTRERTRKKKRKRKLFVPMRPLFFADGAAREGEKSATVGHSLPLKGEKGKKLDFTFQLFKLQGRRVKGRGGAGEWGRIRLLFLWVWNS